MFAGTVTNYFMIYAISIIPLVEITLILCLGPLISALLAYYLLRERLQRIEIVCLLIAFVGVIVLILADQNVIVTDTAGTPTSSMANIAEEAKSKLEHFLAYLFIILIPFIMGYGFITIRYMRYLHPNIPGFYTSGTQMIIMYIFVACTGRNYSWLSNFDTIEFVMFTFMSFLFTM